MNFSEALEEIKKGEAVTRDGWNGKGMFVFMRSGVEHSLHSHSVNNIPYSVRAYFAKKEKYTIHFVPTLCMKTVNDAIVTWVPGQADMLADDWQIITDCFFNK